MYGEKNAYQGKTELRMAGTNPGEPHILVLRYYIKYL